MTTLLFILLLLNIVTFFIYGLDKYKSIHQKWRIPEKTLLFLAFIGGSAGALLGMSMWHHKTQHFKFRFGIPFVLLVQITLVCFIYYDQIG